MSTFETSRSGLFLLRDLTIGTAALDCKSAIIYGAYAISLRAAMRLAALASAILAGNIHFLIRVHIISGRPNSRINRAIIQANIRGLA